LKKFIQPLVANTLTCNLLQTGAIAMSS